MQNAPAFLLLHRHQRVTLASSTVRRSFCRRPAPAPSSRPKPRTAPPPKLPGQPARAEPSALRVWGALCWSFSTVRRVRPDPPLDWLLGCLGQRGCHAGGERLSFLLKSGRGASHRGEMADPQPTRAEGPAFHFNFCVPINSGLPAIGAGPCPTPPLPQEVFDHISHLGFTVAHDNHGVKIILMRGLPWWLSGKESTCQCKRHRVTRRPRKISDALERLSLCGGRRPGARELRLRKARSHAPRRPRPASGKRGALCGRRNATETEASTATNKTSSKNCFKEYRCYSLFSVGVVCWLLDSQ